MNLPDLGLLALLDGAADILPIDASAHALLAARLLGWRAGPVAAGLHLGAALALTAYFWRDMMLIGSGLWRLRKARIEAGTRLLAKILLAATPLLVVLSGLVGLPLPVVTDLIPIGLITAVMGLVMLFADRLSLTVKRIEHVGFFTTLSMGLAQLLSLVTGVGRVPAALITARLFGMERQAAYRLSVLASAPYLWVRGSGELVNIARHGGAIGLSDALAVGLTFAVVLAALPFGMAVIKRHGLTPFALYRVVFGLLLIGLGML